MTLGLADPAIHPYRMYAEDEIDIDSDDLDFDIDGYPCRTRITYTDLTGKLECQDVEAFANSEAALAGWWIESSGWTKDGRTFVIEGVVPSEV